MLVTSGLAIIFSVLAWFLGPSAFNPVVALTALTVIVLAAYTRYTFGLMKSTEASVEHSQRTERQREARLRRELQGCLRELDVGNWPSDWNPLKDEMQKPGVKDALRKMLSLALEAGSLETQKSTSIDAVYKKVLQIAQARTNPDSELPKLKKLVTEFEKLNDAALQALDAT